MKKIKAFFITCILFLAGAILLLLLLAGSFFISRPFIQKNITWGVNFSQTQAENLNLDWKATYLAILEELQVKNIKLLTDWDKIETDKNMYDFNDIDWQIVQAQSHNAMCPDGLIV